MIGNESKRNVQGTSVEFALHTISEMKLTKAILDDDWLDKG